MVPNQDAAIIYSVLGTTEVVLPSSDGPKPRRASGELPCYHPQSMTSALDILAIAAHRDDVEQTCGGTLLKMAQRGHRTGILDLTQGEMGTRGTAEQRAHEAVEAAKTLRVVWRQALDIPDGHVENTWENQLKVARVIREQRPRVVILPYWDGRHPDHYTSSKLGYEACFLAGLAKLDLPGKPHRPCKVIYAKPYYDLGPILVVDLSA